VHECDRRQTDRQRYGKCVAISGIACARAILRNSEKEETKKTEKNYNTNMLYHGNTPAVPDLGMGNPGYLKYFTKNCTEKPFQTAVCVVKINKNNTSKISLNLVKDKSIYFTEQRYIINNKWHK